MKKLPVEFYNRKDVLQVAKDLLGKILITKFDGIVTSARIVETEAYIAITDKASRSFNGKRTARNEYMYAEPATVYVYICYGLHHLFNVVTNKKNIPDAVLIRAGEPLEGIDNMLKRTAGKKIDNTITKGPGNLAKALGINKTHGGMSVLEKTIFIVDDSTIIKPESIAASKRIGVDGAAEAAEYPFRYYIKGNKYVSGYPNK